MGRAVLLAEDELFIALDLVDALHAEGLDVDGPYMTASEGMKACETRLPRCAVLDVRLADGDVFPLADRLQAGGVPLVFHSGHMTSRDLAQRYAGAQFFEKPYPAQKLAKVVRTLVLDACGAKQKLRD